MLAVASALHWMYCPLCMFICWEWNGVSTIRNHPIIGSSAIIVEGEIDTKFCQDIIHAIVSCSPSLFLTFTHSCHTRLIPSTLSCLKITHTLKVTSSPPLPSTCPRGMSYQWERLGEKQFISMLISLYSSCAYCLVYIIYVRSSSS